MTKRTFRQRSEDFGFSGRDPWALDALGLVFRVPRVYRDLAEAWDVRYPGTMAALDRLVRDGWVSFQRGVLVDVRTGELVHSEGKRLDRYTISRAGRALSRQAQSDSAVIEDRWQRVSPANAVRVSRLLAAFDVNKSAVGVGVSAPQAVAQSGLADRTGRWWVHKLHEEGLIERLEERHSDSREVIPAHYRPTRGLAQQLADVFEAFPSHAHLGALWRISRSRYLPDIDPARLGVSGATDYDHDVRAQQIVAKMLHSPRLAERSVFDVEPRYALLASELPNGAVQFSDDGDAVVIYQPDAVLVERDALGRRRNIVEYERYQTRRDGWAHLERFCGYIQLRQLPSERAAVRFVVDSEARVRGYVELIEAFCDYLGENPARSPRNSVVLFVASVPRVLSSPDALDDRTWHRIELPSGEGACRLHPAENTPFNQYFSKAAK